MANKLTQRVILATGLVLMTGFAAHLGGCNVDKVKSYYNALAKRAGQFYDALETAYNFTKPYIEDAVDLAEEKDKDSKKESEKKTLAANLTAN